MVNTKVVAETIKKNKDKMSFEQIWKAVKKEIMETAGEGAEEISIKSDLYISMMEDQDIIMLGDNIWDLRDIYSFEEQQRIAKVRMTSEIELKLEEFDDTREMKLGHVDGTEDEE